MDNGKADIIAGIRELRAKAAEQLTGNEYYMIVQQLDSLVTSVELSEDAARSVFTLISARLGGTAPAISAAGAPEVPETPSTPAQPDTPSTPEQPVVPDSPAQPDNSPGPEIPPPPSSPAEPQTPPEVSAAPVSAGSDEPVQIVAPSANSFGMPQATVAIRLAETVAPSEPVTGIHETARATGLAAAVLATRALVEEKLSGNSYYSAANLLGQLQILPPASGGGEAGRPDNFEGALTLLRREAAHLSGVAHDEAARVIAALENVLMPKPQTPAEKPAETAAPQPAAPAPEAAEPEPEPEPRTGFDNLAEAAWQRVLHVSVADPRPAGLLNGSKPPAAAATAQPAAPAPVAAVAAAPAEMMAQDIGEAFNDGGSESRSSEPCYLHEFEFATAQSGASEHQEPAAEAGADAAPEAQRPAPVSAETEGLTVSAETGTETSTAIEAEEAASTIPDETVTATEPQVAAHETAVPLVDPAVAAAASQTTMPEAVELLAEAAVAATVSEAEEPEQAEPIAEAVITPAGPQAIESVETELKAAAPLDEPGISTAAAEPVAPEPMVAVVEAEPATAVPAIETPKEPAGAYASAESEPPAETPAAQPGKTEQAHLVKPSRRGFFGRLFGGTAPENRR